MLLVVRRLTTNVLNSLSLVSPFKSNVTKQLLSVAYDLELKWLTALRCRIVVYDLEPSRLNSKLSGCSSNLVQGVKSEGVHCRKKQENVAEEVDLEGYSRPVKEVHMFDKLKNL